jgi:dihydrofolate reductase
MINAIFATDSSGGMGNNGALPWPHNKEDMAWFRMHTMGSIVLMGRKTWESIGSKPLPGRKNVVVTSDLTLEGPDLVLDGPIDQVLEVTMQTFPGREIFVIGGMNVYKQALPLCRNVYISVINGTYPADVSVDEEFTSLVHQFSNILEVADYATISTAILSKDM